MPPDGPPGPSICLLLSSLGPERLQLWHEAERGLPGGDALGVLGPDLHLHQEERIEAGLHRCHHPPERGLSGARGMSTMLQAATASIQGSHFQEFLMLCLILK
ncbi:uncharacterized protein LOC144576507 isoform X3 [Callithrix jacchus]